MPLPSDVRSATVTATFPDPPEGLQVRFRPDLQQLAARLPTVTPPLIFVLDEVVASVGSDGRMRGPDGQPGVQLLADPDLEPSGWTWHVRITSPSTAPVDFSIAVTAGATIDLSDAVPVPADLGTALAAWVQAVADTRAARDATIDAASGAAAAIAAAIASLQTAPRFVQATLGSGDGQAHWSPGPGGLFTAPVEISASTDTDRWDAGTHAWAVPVPGLYQLTGAIRLTDDYPAGSNIGMGVATSSDGGPDFVWHGVTAASRHTFQLSRFAHFDAGQAVYLYAYFEGPGTVATAALGIALIAAD